MEIILIKKKMKKIAFGTYLEICFSVRSSAAGRKYLSAG